MNKTRLHPEIDIELKSDANQQKSSPECRSMAQYDAEIFKMSRFGGV